MKSSSTTVTSTSLTAPQDTQPHPLSTAPPPPDLKVEFLPAESEWDNNGDSSVSSPSSSSSSSPAPPCCDIRPALLSLSSPELLSELKAPRSRPLRHVPAQNGLTTVFSGRGGQASGPALSGRPANQRSLH